MSPAGAGRGSGGGTVEARIDAGDLARLLRDARRFDAELAKATRRRLRDAAKPVVDLVKSHLRGGGFRADVGLTKGLAAGTKLSIRTGARDPGVSITTTGARLPGDKQAMVRAFDKPSFRHRVYGHDVWVTQSGRPYFGTVIEPQVGGMRRGMELALADAAETIEAGQVGH